MAVAFNIAPYIVKMQLKIYETDCNKLATKRCEKQDCYPFDGRLKIVIPI